jgi:hypothetical protein
MGLSRALGRLPADRFTETVVRDVLLAMRRHAGRRLTCADVAGLLSVAQHQIASVLEALAEAFVLDSDGEPPSYRYRRDTASDLEIERFLRRADCHDGMLRSNVAKFRQRYGYR